MASNLDIITDAYRMVNIIPMTAAPGAELGSAGLRRLNSMMAFWSASDGIDLGWFSQDDQSATAPLDDGVLEGVTANLAVRFAATAGVPTPAEVKQIASETYSALLRVAVVDALEPADMSNMPIGTGYGARWDIENG
jgi:hypothetical protein